MTDTNLYNVLNGLHQTDKNMWGKLSGVQDRLSGLISGAFTSGKIAIGIGDKLSASQFSISNTTDSTLFTAENANLTLGTTIANAAAVKDYVDDRIEALSSEQGAALTGVTVSGAVKKLDGNKTVEIGIDVDGTTISQTDGSLKSLLTLKKLDTPASATFAATYELQDGNGTKIGDQINIVKDQFLSAASYDDTTEELVLTFNVPSGTLETRIDVADMVHEYTGVSGVAVNIVENGQSTISGVVDGSSESFLTVGANGFKLAGVQDAIDAKGNAISSYLWDSTNGVAYQALNGYTSGNAVSNKFQAIDDKLEAAGLNTNFTEGEVLVGGTSGNIAESNFTIGGTDKTDFGSATELAVEAGVKDYVDTNISTAVSGVTTADQFVFGAGAGAVKTTGKTLYTTTEYVADTNGAKPTMTDDVIPTAGAVKSYVEDGLAGLLTQVEALRDSIGTVNA